MRLTAEKIPSIPYFFKRVEKFGQMRNCSDKCSLKLECKVVYAHSTVPFQPGVPLGRRQLFVGVPNLNFMLGSKLY